MQKKILLFVVCITMTGITVNAQNKKHVTPPPPPAAPIAPFEMIAAPPPPPPPPPPLPPVPPVEEEAGYESIAQTVIVNGNGYEVSIQRIKETPMVYLEKNGVTQKIKLSTWNANRKFYEKKYGQLPAPPPLPETTAFGPVIIPDTQ